MTTFNPAAEHRCARCGQWWWSTHTCPDQLGRVVPPASMPIEVTTTDKIIAERDALRSENAALFDVLHRNGFRRCDVPACNCGSWHHRFGLLERMDEIKSALADAGHPLSNDNGNLPLNALSSLVAERDTLRAEVERLRAENAALAGERLAERLKEAEAAAQAGRVEVLTALEKVRRDVGSLVQERDALRALNSMLRAELQSTKDALRAEVERLRADAERYRWLRSWRDRVTDGQWPPDRRDMWVAHYRAPDASDPPLSREALDEAIDAARAAQEGKT